MLRLISVKKPIHKPFTITSGSLPSICASHTNMKAAVLGAEKNKTILDISLATTQCPLLHN